MLNFLLDLIFPRFCVGCGKLGKYFCRDCRKEIKFYFWARECHGACSANEANSKRGPVIQGTLLPTKRNRKFFALAHYDGIIRQAIHDIKYRGHFAIIKELVAMFPASPAGEPNLPFTFDYLVPVPLSPKRLHDREFNQSEKLAQFLNYELSHARRQAGIKNYAKTKVLDCLIRTKETKPQFNLSEKERLKNVRGAFAVKRNSYSIIHNSTVCLVDDVSTTGATISECAKVLRQAGVKKVCAACIAKG
jgi:ComF family protein